MLKRNCPTCKVEMSYKTKDGYKQACKKESLCKNCGIQKRANTVRRNGSKKGKNNPFYGKSHTEEAKSKIKDNNKKNQDVWKTQDFRDKMSQITFGTNNPRYGKSNYDLWVEKYGKEKAEEKLKIFKNKLSKVNSGSGNPMYGKPSPKGSGIGWKGWYNKCFFRSLRELTHMLSMEEDGIEWRSAENIRIEYTDPLGNERTYSPDFLVGNKLVEIKPIRLQDTPSVLLKTRAAQKYCEDRGMAFEILDVEIDSVLINKHIKDIKFLGDYKEKYENYQKK